MPACIKMQILQGDCDYTTVMASWLTRCVYKDSFIFSGPNQLCKHIIILHNITIQSTINTCPINCSPLSAFPYPFEGEITTSHKDVLYMRVSCILYIIMPKGPAELFLIKGMFHFACAIPNVNWLTIMSWKNLGKHHYQTVQKTMLKLQKD